MSSQAEIFGNLHANTDIALAAGSQVTGDVSAVGEVTGEGTVVGDITEGADPLLLPEIPTIATLRLLADRILTGDQTFTDAVVDDVVFVEGSATFAGSIDGQGTIIASDEVIFLATTGERPVGLGPQTLLSWISPAAVHVGDGRHLRGAIRSGSSVELGQSVDFEGVIVADDRLLVGAESRIEFFDFDLVAPEINLLQPPDGSVLPTVWPRIEALLSDDFSGLRLESISLVVDGMEIPPELGALFDDGFESGDLSGWGSGGACSREFGACSRDFNFPLPEPLPDGVHSAELSVTDHSDNLAQLAFTFTTDTVPPDVAITRPAEPVIFNEPTPEIRVEYSDATSAIDLATVVLTLDGSDLTAMCTVDPASVVCVPPALAPGQHSLAVEVADLAGNMAQTSLEFELISDLEPPLITIERPTDGGEVTDPVVLVEGTVTDDNSVTSVTVNGQATALVGNAFSTTVGLSEGANLLLVEAVDTAGNVGTSSVTVTLRTDTMAPALVIVAPPEGIFVATRRPAIVLGFEDDDGVDLESLMLKANGAPLAVDCVPEGLGSRCALLQDLPNGQIFVEASLDDLVGNTATASVSFTVDLAAVEVTITEPEDSYVTADAELTVGGTVGPDVVRLEVNGVEAEVADSQFSATLTLREGTQMLVALATKANGNSGTASIEVTHDVVAPIVRIDAPRDGLQTSAEQITVTGLVNDIVSGGLVPRVEVNGLEAAVADGTFMLADLPLEQGVNLIEVIATDTVGNQGSHSTTVHVDSTPGARIVLVSGNGQAEGVRTTLPEPLVVEVTDGSGIPLAGRAVRFEVVRNSGTLRRHPMDEPRRTILIPTDGSGLAAVHLTLGETAGEGNNRVRATSLGVVGEVEFCASASGAAATHVVATLGDNQRGLVSYPLPTPLEAIVVDGDGNPLAGVAVTFEVVIGGGQLDGQTTLTRTTSRDGLVRGVLTLGPQPGINNNIVRVTADGLGIRSATFSASGLAAGDPANTRFSGVVLDSGHTPIPGAVVHIEGTAATAVTDEAGRFLLDEVPVGHLEVAIDPTASPRPETFPPLVFETVTIAGHDNTLGQPVVLPRIDLENSQIVGGPEDVTLVMDQIEEASLTVFANSTTFPDGSPTGPMTISQVHLDKVPMLPPMGSMILAWTIQPAGVVFDPPARVTIPNTGLLPGRIIEISQFDHALNRFVIVGTGTVSQDGTRMVSDPGFGITRSGWGGCVPPPPPPTCLISCDDGNACTEPIPDSNCSCAFEPKDCDDEDPCTVNRCDPAVGCVSEPLCPDDDNACTESFCDPETGGCSTEPIECDDDNLCTADSCDPATGCVFEPLCDDGDACTESFCDPETGACTTEPIECDDGNLCTADSCDPAIGCVFEPICPDDDNACTESLCDPETGACSTAPKDCDDGSLCTVDSCDPAIGCIHDPVCEDDMDLCTESVCDEASGTCSTVPKDCDDGNPCTEDMCDPRIGCLNSPRCEDDGSLCTESFCDPQTGGCTIVPRDCGDGNLCTEDSCDEVTGCVNLPIECDDGSLCTTDSCDPATGCVFEPHCQDTDICTDNICDPETGACSTQEADCNDFDSCTEDSCDSTFGCVNTPRCQDNDACTEDSCDPVTGACSHTPQNCDDANTCTMDTCDSATGDCEFIPISGACDDLDVCTLTDMCQEGVCVGGARPSILDVEALVDGQTSLEVDVGEPVAFSVTVTDSGCPDVGFEWNFGDSNTSTDQNPTHTYNDVGSFSPSVNVFCRVSGSVCDLKSDSVDVEVGCVDIQNVKVKRTDEPPTVLEETPGRFCVLDRIDGEADLADNSKPQGVKWEIHQLGTFGNTVIAQGSGRSFSAKTLPLEGDHRVVFFCDMNGNGIFDDSLLDSEEHAETEDFAVNPVALRAQSVNRHVNTSVTEVDVDASLAAGSLLLRQKNRILGGGEGDVRCCVDFHRSGSLGDFAGGGLDVITTAAELEAVFATPGDIKVVTSIMGSPAMPVCNSPGTVLGCGRAGGSLIITLAAHPDVWMHELGHVDGLDHRDSSVHNIMHSTAPNTDTVNDAECSAYEQ